MTYQTTLRSAVCFAAFVASGAAQADVTAAEVWADWKSQISLYGEDSVTVRAEEASGSTLVVRDVVMSFQDSDVKVDAKFGDLTFEEMGNGAVRVTMEDSYPVAITGNDDVVVTILVSQSELEMIVSGDPNALNYKITADRYTVALDDIVDNDITFTGDVQMVANKLSSTYSTTTDEMRNIVYEAAVASIDVLIDIPVPDGTGEYVTGGAKIENMTIEGDLVLPLDADFENPDDMFTDGFSITGGYSVENGAYIFDVNADGDQATGSISTGLTTLSGEMNNDVVSYETLTKDVTVSVTSSGLPFPVDISLNKYGVGFTMPTSKGDEPSDFGLSLDFIDLTLNDMIWDLFDPNRVLPRDPATAQFALSGLAKPLFDMMDPSQQDAMNTAEMPFELAQLTLENLRIAAAGALVTGQGAFTFDNSDMQSFAPLPKPEGDVIVEISGLNRLLDNLVTMGLITQKDVMAPRMMMGMFARSTGDDSMETKLEVTSNGQVLANGQRIR